jgi:2-methylcitrate dehydratase PrpD
MAKPFHAGKAAANGVLAARLAKRGFTADEEVLDAEQGFLATQGRSQPSAEARFEAPGALIVETLFKYHAACYLTQSSIDAISALRDAEQLTSDDIASIDLHVGPAHLKTCNIEAPRTGLEIKFSLRHLSALAVLKADTAAVETYVDATARDASAVALRNRVRVHADGAEDTSAEVRIQTRSGAILTRREDVGVPVTDFGAQQNRLEQKFQSLAPPVIGLERAERLREAINGLEQAAGVGALLG